MNYLSNSFEMICKSLLIDLYGLYDEVV